MSAGWYSVENMQWLTICIGLAVDQGTLRPHLISEDLIHHSSALHHFSYTHDSTEEAPSPSSRPWSGPLRRGRRVSEGERQAGGPGVSWTCQNPWRGRNGNLAPFPVLNCQNLVAESGPTPAPQFLSVIRGALRLIREIIRREGSVRRSGAPRVGSTRE